MLSSLATRDVQTSGVTETRAFTIKANGKAFKVLIDGLYSDKIRAVTRELWSNAFDAHIAVGTPEVPFECQLPTVFDPVFRVRDFGVSLSHDDVMCLYTTVFESTKDGSNAQVGKLGLGSKSPFAYVDTFAVTAWLTGEKRIYSAYIGSDYVPQISLMSREPSDEPQGLEVSFPVKAKDCDAFVLAAEKVALGFQVLPSIIGRNVNFVKLSAIMEEAGLWQLVEANEGYFYPGTAYARQGCVVYPIDANAIPEITDVQASVLRSPFFIDFPIGDLEITANRESLSYDATTCKNILDVADIIVADMRKRYESEIAACTTYWEACTKYTQMQRGGLHSAIKGILSKGMKWRGRELSDHISLSALLGRQDVNVSGLNYSPSSARRRRQLKWEPHTYVTVYPSKTAIYFQDVTAAHTTMAHCRIRHHFASRTPGVESLAWFKADPKSMAWKRVYAAMGRPPLIDVTKLERPPVEKEFGVKKPVPMRRLNDVGREFVSHTVNPSDNIIYVELDRGSVNGPTLTRTMSPAQVARTRDLLTMLGCVDVPAGTKIIGVPRSHAKMPKRNPHWRCLWDVAKEQIGANFDPVVAAKAEKCSEIVREGEFHFVRKLNEANLAPASSKGMMAKLMQLYGRIVDRAHQADTQRKWFELAKIVSGYDAITLPPYYVHWEPLAKRVEDTYPLLNVVSSSYLKDDDVKHLVDYVNLIDERQEKEHCSVSKPDELQAAA